jgi:hypothetical protein
MASGGGATAQKPPAPVCLKDFCWFIESLVNILEKRRR